MSSWKPLGRADVVMRAGRRQRMLYDALSNSFHALNETAEFIWSLCDGRHSLEELVDAVKTAFEVPEGVDVTTDVERTVSAMERKGLFHPREEELEETRA